MLGSDFFVSPTAFEFPHSLPGLLFSPHREEVLVDGTSEDRDHDYYNSIPGKQPPEGGISDVRIQVQATEQMAYCPIRCEKLCYLVSTVYCYWFQRSDSVLTTKTLDLRIFKCESTIFFKSGVVNHSSLHWIIFIPITLSTASEMTTYPSSLGKGKPSNALLSYFPS